METLIKLPPLARKSEKQDCEKFSSAPTHILNLSQISMKIHNFKDISNIINMH